jgi:hypothetical protein
MKRLLFSVLLGISLLALSPVVPVVGEQTAYAEKRFNLEKSLKRLKANPRYRGKILGVRAVRTSRGKLMEVRILKSNDKIILVYIDPDTGGVVSDSRK